MICWQDLVPARLEVVVNLHPMTGNSSNGIHTRFYRDAYWRTGTVAQLPPSTAAASQTRTRTGNLQFHQVGLIFEQDC